MFSYKDQDWCSVFQDGNCKNAQCPYALNKQRVEEAKVWWGGNNFPFMMSDRQTEDCGYEG